MANAEPVILPDMPSSSVESAKSRPPDSWTAEVECMVSDRMVARHAQKYSVADAIQEELYRRHRVTVDDSDGSWRRWAVPALARAALGSCQVWLRGRDGKPGCFCKRPLEEEAYYCEHHAREHRGAGGVLHLLKGLPGF